MSPVEARDDVHDDAHDEAHDSGTDVVVRLQVLLDLLNDLALTLKHVHWNVIGPHFIAVHTMLDPQAAEVRDMVDTVAERIATLGGAPDGRPDGIVRRRPGGAYELGRADALIHLAALDDVYTRVIEGHRRAVEALAGDPVTQDLVTTQCGELEKLRWFVRAHGASPDAS